MDEYSAGDRLEAIHSSSELQDIAQKLAVLADEIKAMTATPLADADAVSRLIEGSVDTTGRRDDAMGTGALPNRDA